MTKVFFKKVLKTKNPNISIRVLWYLQGSNQGHMDFQSIALPSELRYLAVAGANIEAFLVSPKHFLKKIYSYLWHSKFHKMILVVDVGNSRIKAAVFEEATILEFFVFSKNEAKINFEKILNRFKNLQEFGGFFGCRSRKRVFFDLSRSNKRALYFTRRRFSFSKQLRNSSDSRFRQNGVGNRRGVNVPCAKQIGY